MGMIEIDGSHGEGGGQMLRSSLALAMVTGRPFRMRNIRANRDKPGLARQHLTAVTAAATICGADVTGAAVGSRELTFAPGQVRPGEYHFPIGTAGATPLVFQAILPALVIGDRPSHITLEGGTYNSHAPSIDYLEHGFLPLLARMGPRVAIARHRDGFYPRGGGRWEATIMPVSKLTPLTLTERGPLVRRRAESKVAAIPPTVMHRELARVRERLGWDENELIATELPPDQGPGNALTLRVEHAHVTEIFTSLGARGVTSEQVAGQAIDEALDYLTASAPVGPHLADQLLIPLALARGGSYVTVPLTLHTRTNIEIIQRFLDVSIRTTESEHGAVIDIA